MNNLSSWIYPSVPKSNTNDSQKLNHVCIQFRYSELGVHAYAYVLCTTGPFSYLYIINGPSLIVYNRRHVYLYAIITNILCSILLTK